MEPRNCRWDSIRPTYRSTGACVHAPSRGVEPASGIEDSARPRPISQRLYGSSDPMGRERLETLRQPWPFCVRDALRLLQTLLAVLLGLFIRFHAPLVESLASGFVVAEDPGRHAFEQHPIEGCRQPGMRLREEFKSGAKVDDGNVSGLNRQKNPTRISYSFSCQLRCTGSCRRGCPYGLQHRWPSD